MKYVNGFNTNVKFDYKICSKNQTYNPDFQNRPWPLSGNTFKAPHFQGSQFWEISSFRAVVIKICAECKEDAVYILQHITYNRKFQQNPSKIHVKEFIFSKVVCFCSKKAPKRVFFKDIANFIGTPIIGTPLKATANPTYFSEPKS